MRMKKFFILTVIFLALSCNSHAEEIPSRYDLRDYGRISSVKNQGISGPCWAFAALASMESNYLTQKLNTDGKIPIFQNCK